MHTCRNPSPRHFQCRVLRSSYPAGTTRFSTQTVISPHIVLRLPAGDSMLSSFKKPATMHHMSRSNSLRAPGGTDATVLFNIDTFNQDAAVFTISEAFFRKKNVGDAVCSWSAASFLTIQSQTIQITFTTKWPRNATLPPPSCQHNVDLIAGGASGASRGSKKPPTSLWVISTRLMQRTHSFFFFACPQR